MTDIIILLAFEKMKLSFCYSADVETWDAPDFPVVLHLIEKHVGKRKGNLNLIFVSDPEIRELNRTFRHKDAVTDVLSFPYNDPSQLVGEVYIALGRAKAQAREKRCSFRKEMNKLFIHGVLHVLGYDHVEDSDYRVMNLFERKVAKSFYSNQKKSINK